MEHLKHAAGNLYARIMIVMAVCFVLVLMNAALAEATTAGATTKPVVTPSPRAYAQATSRADTLVPVPEPEPEPPIIRVYDPVPTDTLFPTPEPEPEPQLVRAYNPIPNATRIRVGAHTFTTDKMSEAYDPVYVGSVEFLMVKKGVGFGFEIGWISGEGTPPLVDSHWVVTDSWVKMSALLLELNVHYNFLDDTGSELFGPYVAAGPAMWVGSERIAAEATRAPVGIVEEFKVEQLALGLSFGVSGMIGTTVRIKGNFKALIETRYVLSTSGSTLDLVSEEEDNDRLDATLYSAVERPGFNFTGWQITIGVQW